MDNRSEEIVEKGQEGVEKVPISAGGAEKATILAVGDVFELGGYVYYVRKKTLKDVIIRRVRKDQMNRLRKVEEHENRN